MQQGPVKLRDIGKGRDFVSNMAWYSEKLVRSSVLLSGIGIIGIGRGQELLSGFRLRGFRRKTEQ